MTFEEYDRYDATALADLIRTGAVSEQEVFDTAVARIETEDPALNSIVHRHFDLAQAQIDAGLPDGPFRGVPFAIKNTGLDVAGMELSTGSALFRGCISPADCTLATRYRAAGLVILGKTNTPEFALSFATEPAAFGPTHNPWKAGHSAGGSSGGSAAAVAAGLLPFANASDGAGSTRLPAAHTNLFGFKPSRMHNPLGPIAVEAIAGMSTPHALTRSVRDSAALLDLTAGPDQGDPYGQPPRDGSFLAATLRDPRPLRIGMVLRSPVGTAVDPEILDRVRQAAVLMEHLGHHVTEIDDAGYDGHALKTAWRVIPGTGVAAAVMARGAALGLADPPAALEPVNAEWVREGLRLTARDYLGAVNQLHRTARDMGRFFARFDILLTPVAAHPAPAHGDMASTGMTLDAFYDRFWAHSPFTCVFNASGCPAMSVPFGFLASGLPVGVHFGAGFGGDALLFALAGQIERAAPWAHVRPGRAA